MKIETCPHTKNNNKQTYPIKNQQQKSNPCEKKSVVICSRPFVPLPLFVEKKINTVPVFLVLNIQKSLKEKKDLLTEDEHF